MNAKKTTRKPAKSTTAKGKPAGGWTPEERAAAKAYAQELKAEARRGADKAAGESDVLAKFAEMPPSDRALAKRIHAVVKASAPDLSPRTWYGMPAYANQDGKVVCFFTPASKFKER